MSTSDPENIVRLPADKTWTPRSEILREPYSVQKLFVSFDHKRVIHKAKDAKCVVILHEYWDTLTSSRVAQWIADPYLYSFEIGMPGRLQPFSSLVDVLDHFGLGQIPSDLRGYFKMAWEGAGYGPMTSGPIGTALPEVIGKPTRRRIFAYCTSIRTCRAVDGKRESPIVCSVVWGSDFFDFVEEPQNPLMGLRDPTSFTLPQSVEGFFFESVLDKMETGQKNANMYYDFSFQPYYEESMSSYSAMTFHRHTQQLLPIVESIPDGYTVIAPGDGLGVVATLCDKFTKPYRGGDIVVRPSSHPSVKKESLIDTIRTWKLHTKSVVVLSYVWTFLTEEERDEVRAGKFNCIILDAHLISLPEGSPVGSTCWMRSGQNSEIPLLVEIPPEFKKKNYDNLLFTENLVNLPYIEYADLSPYVDYYISFRRTAIAKAVIQPSGERPFVVSTIHEYITCARRGWKNVYVGCMGLVDPPIRFIPPLNCDAGLVYSNLLRERVVYFCSTYYIFDRTDVLHASLRNPAPNFQNGASFWFCAISPNITKAYPVKEDQYQAVKCDKRRFMADSEHDCCQIRFVIDGTEMLSDSFSFSRSEKMLVCRYGGSEFKQKWHVNKWVNYLIFVLRFQDWTFGPSPACLRGLLSFLKLSEDVQLPSYWTISSWKDYWRECEEDDLAVNPWDYCVHKDVVPWDDCDTAVLPPLPGKRKPPQRFKEYKVVSKKDDDDDGSGGESDQSDEYDDAVDGDESSASTDPVDELVEHDGKIEIINQMDVDGTSSYFEGDFIEG